MNGNTVEIQFVASQAGRPPLVSVRLNVTLCNNTEEPQWFLLPATLNLPTAPLQDGVDGVEVYEIQGQGKVVLAQFQGRGGFQALYLPAKARIVLNNLGVAYWGKVPEDVIPMEIITARQLIVGGEPAQAWLGEAVMSDVSAVVNVAEAKRRNSRHTPDRHEVAVSTVAEHRTLLSVSVNSKE